MDENKNPENVNSGAENQEGTENNNEVNYEELIKTDKKLQSFLDSRTTASNKTAVENARKQWELENNEKVTEAEKLAKMTETQKLQYQIQKEKQEKENSLAELNAYKMKEQAVKIASEKGLDVSLLDLIDFKTITAEKLNENIDSLSTTFNKAVEKVVNERLKEKTPVQKSGMGGSQPKPIPTIF